jgi:Uma2 family endonuclease
MTTATLPAPAIPPLPNPDAPRTLRWTVKQFHEAKERRAFGEGRRVILIRGELVELSPMKPQHAQGVRRIVKAIPPCFGAGFFTQSQLPLVLGQDSDPMPDFAVIADDMERYGTIHPSAAVLVVEVADSTRYFDTTTKVELYASANIPEYWVVDLENRRLLIHRDPMPLPDGGMTYRTQMTLGPAETVSPLAAPTATLCVAELLP